MATSTPLVAVHANKDMRRSIFENNLEATPLRRRSNAPNPAPILETTNDEIERSKRRSMALMQRRISSLPTPSLNESSIALGEQELKDHFQTCSKLYLENKITPKNAWQLQIIDILKQLSQKTSPDTLQVAGTSLDIGAKVYSVRVDDIHSDGLKLASTMARATEKRENEAQEDHEGETGEDAGNTDGPPKKKKRRRDLRGDKNTISKDPKSLKANLPKLESVFFSTRTNADSNGVDNLFTNTLRTDHSSYKFPLLTNEPAWITCPDPVIKNTTIQKNLNVEQINVKLCLPFHDFYVDEWDPEEEEKQLAAEKSLLSQKQDEVVYDENGIPIPELDGSIHDIFENNANCDPVEDALDDDEDVQEEILPQIRNEIEHIVDFNPEETGGFQKSEYSYNTVISTHTGKIIDQIWAGPSHWKLKFLRQSSAKFSGQTTTVKTVAKQSKRNVQPEIINFLEDIGGFDMNSKLKIKKKSATLDPHKLQLPPPDASCHKIVANINELLSKPGTCPGRKKDKEIEEKQVDYEVAEYQYDNPNDSQYCAQLNDDDHHTDDDMDREDTPISKEVAQGSNQKFLGENLVDAPESVPKSYVTYALQAKHMDMKKLKAAIWQILTSAQTETSPHPVSVSATTISKVYSRLPSLLPEKLKLNLSFPLAFVALLQLCNEHNLYLEQHADYKDFGIVGPSH